jgi:tripartite-type tricarboxylate transporter receptor subunit TctC
MSIPSKSRRDFVLQMAGASAGLAAMGMGIMPRDAMANYPIKQIETLIPFAPGGGTDRSARFVAEALANILKTNPFQLKNMPGAGSLIAQKALNKGPSDGSLTLITPIPHVAWLDVLQPKEFNSKQIAWLGSYFTDPNVFLVKKDSPYKTMDEFLDAARKSKRPFTASVSSPMSAAHAATVILRERANIQLKVVPFKGGGPARNAVAGGQVDCCMAPYWSATNVLSLTRALCIFAPKDPSKGLWDAPPAKDVLKFQMPDLSEPYAICVSAETKAKSPANYAQLVKAVAEMPKLPSFQADAEKQKLTPFLEAMSPEQCTAFIADYLKLLDSIKDSMAADLKSM